MYIRYCFSFGGDDTTNTCKNEIPSRWNLLQVVISNDRLLANKHERPMNHNAHLRNQLKSINTYNVEKERKNQHLLLEN